MFFCPIFDHSFLESSIMWLDTCLWPQQAPFISQQLVQCQPSLLLSLADTFIYLDFHYSINASVKILNFWNNWWALSVWNTHRFKRKASQCPLLVFFETLQKSDHQCNLRPIAHKKIAIEIVIAFKSVIIIVLELVNLISLN